MKIQRSTLFILRFDARPQLDLGAMLRGNLAVVRDEPLVATSLTTGETTKLCEQDLRVLQTVSSAEWSARSEIRERLEVEDSILDDLLDRGLLIGDSDDEKIKAMREREQHLTALQWDDSALLYHLTSRVRGMDAGAALKTPDAEAEAQAEAPTEQIQVPDIGFAGHVTPFAGAASILNTPPPAPQAAAPPQTADQPTQSATNQPTVPLPSAGPPSQSATMPTSPTGPFAGAPPAPGFIPQAWSAQPPQTQSPQTQTAQTQTAQTQTPQMTMPQAPPDLAPHLAIASVLGQQLQATVAQYGPPPRHFHTPPAIQSIHDLPQPIHQGWILDVLLQRRTVRLFDPAQPMTLDELSTLLYFTYGAHGAAQLAPGVVGLRKTSPSGGAMHPIEVYPLILQVQKVPPGIYHYSVERHALALLKPLPLEEARRLAETFTSGQSYYATAHALFILSARFFRNFWKYRKSQKAYKVIHLDAGHLSQTLYLLATALGLGAFFTGAVNDIDIEEALGLDGLEEGIIGISGCGRPRQGGDVLGLNTLPFSPRLTRI